MSDVWRIRIILEEPAGDTEESASFGPWCRIKEAEKAYSKIVAIAKILLPEDTTEE